VSVTVRPATPGDVEPIHGFVRELADYERAPEQVTGTVEMLREALFGAASGDPQRCPPAPGWPQT
jgi:hypothetical protein